MKHSLFVKNNDLRRFALVATILFAALFYGCNDETVQSNNNADAAYTHDMAAVTGLSAESGPVATDTAKMAEMRPVTHQALTTVNPEPAEKPQGLPLREAVAYLTSGVDETPAPMRTEYRNDFVVADRAPVSYVDTYYDYRDANIYNGDYYYNKSRTTTYVTVENDYYDDYGYGYDYDYYRNRYRSGRWCYPYDYWGPMPPRNNPVTFFDHNGYKVPAGLWWQARRRDTPVSPNGPADRQGLHLKTSRNGPANHPARRPTASPAPAVNLTGRRPVTATTANFPALFITIGMNVQPVM